MTPRLTARSTYAEVGRTYLRWAPFFLMLATIVFVPVGLIHALTIELEVGSFDLDGFVEVSATALALFALVITGLLGEVFYAGAVAFSLVHAHHGKPPSLAEVAKTIDYGRLIVIDLVYGALVTAGLVLLIVPGVAAFVWLSLAAPVVEIERRGVQAAFTRSVRLIRRRFWVVLAVLGPIELLGDGLTNLLIAFAEDLFGETLLSAWFADVLSNLAFTPFYAVAAVLLTLGLIAEKDGRDPRLHSDGLSAWQPHR